MAEFAEEPACIRPLLEPGGLVQQFVGVTGLPAIQNALVMDDTRIRQTR